MGIAGGGVLVGLLVFVVVAWVRKHVTDPLLDTALSFVVPFAAYVVAEHLEASGVLAVVVAGLLLGHRAPVLQSASSRIAEGMNWRTIAFVLENTVFLLIGLQAHWLLGNVRASDLGMGTILGLCGATFVAVVVLRLVWVFPARFLLVKPGPDWSGRVPPRSYTFLIGWAGMRGVVTLAAAFILRSYWAMAFGLVLSAVLYVAATYIFHPYRPRLSLAKRAELLHVSGWIFLTYAMHVVQFQTERLVLGRFAPPSVLGLYSFSKDLASIFTQELAIALNRVTFVKTAQREGPLSSEPERPIVLLGAYAIITAPIGLGLAAVAEDALFVLFGHQWLPAAPYLRLVAPAAACYAIHGLILSTFQASGLARGSAFLAGAGALMMVASLVTAGFVGVEAQTLAGIALVVNVMLLLIGMVSLGRIAKTPFARLLAAVARPFLAAGIMLAAVTRLTPDSGSPTLDLMASVGMGVPVYVIALSALWGLAGRPAGAERDALNSARAFIDKRKQSRKYP